ncbi:hypothetical protein GFB56_35260 [Ensifer sp. T173]|jgi:hypothetical protein|uniref:Uncharacterized protein n=2 Tax=Sinorhizobium/Ensifer group TaxID=227292 RepID=A0AAW4FXD2_9HYPH|nr:hypothetical protein ASD00_37240 [Ensifer sp. Root31]KQW59068.1 hypothetical protein ASD02_06945 [Ensifer sp. Root1252]KQW74748.1 hypothetical protein ASD03_07585 [Ensifer sp. Root127]KQY62228.1 hypothetical protein ASD52_16285 [Ensifer sp. Root142]KRC67902.1 hypothetical protein ASE32_10405 [Ensifer sp. Root231]KRC98979.1 hypothetical protein ASE47_05600 [Ensifer sp. Root258]MBD9487488.1 hypothetical protein [Ensifer sp. ENS11]MBM3095940.1 hypothetical protein [Ensifer canadensis]OMQ416
MQVSTPLEAFPELGSVANPVVFYDGIDALVCYETSPPVGGGNVVLRFGDVIDFRVTPMNVDGLPGCRYPVLPWAFNEVSGGEETARWEVLSPRFWIISFHDVTIDVLFETVSLVVHDERGGPLRRTLMDVIR